MIPQRPFALKAGLHAVALSPPLHFITWQVWLLGLFAKIMCSICSYQFNISWQVELFVLFKPSRLPHTSGLLNMRFLC